jgi:hypothetical protein
VVVALLRLLTFAIIVTTAGIVALLAFDAFVAFVKFGWLMLLVLDQVAKDTFT